jgi:hypothetical protein
LSGVVDAADMLEPSNADKLTEEVGRYLAAVDLFRAENCEPTWRPEPGQEAARTNGTSVATLALDVELH